MFQQFIKMQYVLNRLSSLEKYQTLLNQCSDYLVSNRYCDGSVRHYRCAIEHFLYWHERENAQYEISKELIECFIKTHLPNCKCSTPAPKRLVEIRPALDLLLKTNNGHADYAVVQQKTSEKDQLINEFDGYLLNVCGLSENTRIYHKRNVKTLLDHFFKRGLINFNTLTPLNIRNFLYKKLTHYKRRTLALFIYSLRCLFKYLQFKGLIGNQLILALPNIREYKASALPEYLSNHDIKKLINAFDQTTPLGKRDYAMLVCMLEIGLRASEVAMLNVN